MLAKNGLLQNSLEEDNFSLEAEFINKLRDAEQDITKLGANVAATKGAKVVWLLVARHTSHVTRHTSQVVLEQELIECERQIMLLERKLELEKETQAACGPPPPTRTTCISTAGVLAIKTGF